MFIYETIVGKDTHLFEEEKGFLEQESVLKSESQQKIYGTKGFLYVGVSGVI